MGWSLRGWSKFKWAGIGRPWYPIYPDVNPDFIFKHKRYLRASPYFTQPVFLTDYAEQVLLRYANALPMLRIPWKPRWQWSAFEETLSVFAEDVTAEASWRQEPVPNTRALYARLRQPRGGGTFYSPNDFAAAHPEPTVAEMSAMWRMPYPDKIFQARRFPYGLSSYFAPPSQRVPCWTEPAITPITSTWTEPAISPITTSWTEPAISPITTTWTEPAITPKTGEC